VIRLLLDQGLPRSTVELLRADGWDVVHACQCDLSTARDEQILEYARGENRVICTLDADFHSILAVTGAANPHPSAGIAGSGRCVVSETSLACGR
jgi:predicted nuclease of predicted toxin-antitoxin system